MVAILVGLMVGVLGAAPDVMLVATLVGVRVGVLGAALSESRP